ncbi:MAG: ribosomal protein L11 methyltransferase [Rhizobiales bacterium 65-9]|nr:MAG: ribosomal protein L11 methyltransferase [Rhizobiales bacterium 65-9]
MREGLIPHTVTTVLKLTTAEGSARAITELFGEIFDPEETGVAAFEDESTKEWRLDVYFAYPPNEEAVRDLIATAAGADAAAQAVFESVEAKDWVAASLDGLKPVEAGRFLVHGSHDRGRVANRTNRIRIEIEAALAFGTGHHGTTLGCLRAFDRLLRRRRPMRVLDVGTGTGVLAIAAARALRRRVIASDIDPVAIEVAKANARANAAGTEVSFIVTPGLRHPAIVAGGPYDLIFANILAGPLKRMAPDLTGALAAGGDVILSGLLAGDVPGVLAVYRACGLSLVASGEIEGWRALVMRRGGAGTRRSLQRA